MNIPEIHAYLLRARHDLWAALEAAPPAALAQPMVPGPEFHCIKDLLSHIIAVQDGWLHEDILRQPPLLASIPELNDTPGGPNYADVDLQTLLNYWQSVHESTSKYLSQLTEAELRRVVTPHDAPNNRFTVDGLLWHVMIHEMRHTAQIAMLLRQQGIKPPALDLYFYL